MTIPSEGPRVNLHESTVELDGTVFTLSPLPAPQDGTEVSAVSVEGKRVGTVSDTNGGPTVTAEAEVPATTLRRVATAWFVAVGMSLCEDDVEAEPSQP